MTHWVFEMDSSENIPQSHSFSTGGSMLFTSRNFWLALIPLFLSFGLVYAQHKHHRMMKSDSAAVQHVVYTCPMDTDVRSSKPGECPKCGMTLVKMERTEPADSADVHRPTKAQLIEDGQYNCCLKQACDQCYRDGENCDCYTTVKKSGVVCKECYEGWQKGKGRVPGIKKERVKAEAAKMDSMDHQD
jgi:hypothetical protein